VGWFIPAHDQQPSESRHREVNNKRPHLAATSAFPVVPMSEQSLVACAAIVRRGRAVGDTVRGRLSQVPTQPLTAAMITSSMWSTTPLGTARTTLVVS